MNLKHVFKNECPNIEELFENCTTLDAYFSNLQKQVGNVKTSNYIKHGFEALVEALIGCEKRTMRLKKYAPIPSCNNDLFVHGLGEKSSGKKVAVMACLVENVETPLTSNANHLTTFTSNSVEHYKVDIEEPKGLRVFSNAKHLHENTQKQFFNDDTVVFYLKSDIENMINENQKFWVSFKNEMKRKPNVAAGKKPINLREYQREASSAVFPSLKGQIILPTGTGKSLIAIDAIYNEIRFLTNKSPCILIMTPRIVLTYQLLGETINYLKSHKIDAQYLNLNSGVFDDDSIKEAMAEEGLPVRDVPSTTSPKTIEFYYQKAVKEGVPFIISATYQSAPQISKTSIPIHMAIHDEAHNLVVGRFSTEAKQEVLKINAGKEIFLTATPAFSDSYNPKATEKTEEYKGLGMDNKNEYGEEIYRKSPKDMIDAGEIVRPILHFVNVNKFNTKGKTVSTTPDNLINVSVDIERNVELMAKVIEESFNEHLKKVKEYSCNPDKIGAKLLVICSGDGAFQGFLKSNSFNLMKRNRKDIKFYGISSNFGAWIDGEHIESQGGWFKEQFMLALRQLKQEDNAIILHIDMLGEGIDVPGITGVLPFRELGTIKSCQTLGRAMRIVPEDRISLYNGTRDATDRNRMLKPYAWAIVPVYSINHLELKQKITEIAKEIRDNAGYEPFEKLITRRAGEKTDINPTPIWTGSEITNLDATHIVDGIIDEIETDEKIAQKQAEFTSLMMGLLKTPSVDEQPKVEVKEKTEAVKQKVSEVYTLTCSGINAKGVKRGDRFVVLAGSEVREKVNNSAQECYQKIRSGIMTKVTNWKTTEDIEFESPSAAACVLLGSSVNGLTAWKINGKTLKENKNNA